MTDLTFYPQPNNFQAKFESDVFNAFDMLGEQYKCFCYPTRMNEIRLLSSVSILNNWNTEKSIFDCLVSKNLVEEFEPKDFIHHGNKVKIQYRFTKYGQELFDKLSPYVDFQKRQEKFIEIIKPQRWE